jgi:nucleoside 2-deoxyribosyltransferase
MKIYIAARFSRRPACNKLAHFLQEKGHTITSRWVLPEDDHVMPTGLSAQAEDSERERFAEEDIEDIEACDWCISLTEEPRGNGRGGRHVEFGYALALKKHMTIIGPKETVFHHVRWVEGYKSINDFMDSYPYMYADRS